MKREPELPELLKCDRCSGMVEINSVFRRWQATLAKWALESNLPPTEQQPLCEGCYGHWQDEQRARAREEGDRRQLAFECFVGDLESGGNYSVAWGRVPQEHFQDPEFRSRCRSVAQKKGLA